MKLEANNIYHIYNRGNNRQTIFPKERNYHFFTEKLKKLICPHADILCYCLMPNHFHLLINAGEDFVHKEFSSKFKTMLSSYTRALQKQENFVGSLFQQNSKAKEINNNEYATTCFHYIHQNPLRARLVNKMENWQHSSFNQYYLSSEGFCDRQSAKELLDISDNPKIFYEESYKMIPKI